LGYYLGYCLLAQYNKINYKYLKTPFPCCSSFPSFFFRLGPRCELTYRAPYDQFLNTDYEPLLRDVHGNVVSAATQNPAHIATGRELLTDATGSPYPLPFQDAYRNGTLLQVSEAEASHVEAGKQPGYLLAAPTLSAARWRAEISGASETSIQNAIDRASARLAEHENALDRLESTRMQGAGASGHRGATGGARDRGGTGTGGAGARSATGNVVYLDDDFDEDDIPSSGDEYDEDFDEVEEAGGRRRAERRRLRREQQPARHSTRLLSQRGQQLQTHVDGSRSRRMNAQELRDRQREEREERHRRRHEAHVASLEQQRRRRERHARATGASGRGIRAASRNTRAGNREEDEFVVGDTSEDDGGGGQEDVDVYEIEIEEEEEDEDFYHEEEEYRDTEDEENGGGGSRRKKRGRRGGGEAANGQRDSKRFRGEENTRNNGGASGGAGPSRPRASTAAAPRASSSYAWLAGAEYRPGFYIPQAGDDVVYLREGHAAVVTATSDKRAPPWQTMHRGRLMRSAEPCRITSVHYSLAQDGTEATAVQASLELNDPASPLCGQSFTVDILPPSSGQAEFIVLRSRFEQAVATPWALGDRCVSYWQTGSTLGADGAGGEWWIGTIVADTREQGPLGVTADMYGCGGLWERWQIKWQGTIDSSGNLIVQEGNNNNTTSNNDADYIGIDGGEGAIVGARPSSIDGGEGAGAGAGAGQEPEPSTIAATATEVEEEEDISRHSPWEIFLWETICDAPIPPGTSRLDDSTCSRLASAIEIAAAEDAWTIFQAAPEWNEAYWSLSGRKEYYNRRVPLPLGLMDIVTRLHLRYYRQKEALQHDIRTISDNAAVFNGSSSDIAADARSLARYLLAVMDVEEVEQVNVKEYVAHEEGGGGHDDWDALEAEEEEDEDFEERKDDEEERALAGVRNRNRTRVSRRPAWYEGAAAFHQPGPDEGRRAPSGSKRRGVSPPTENIASGSRSGRRSSRAPHRVNYREMLEEGGVIDERPEEDTPSAVPPQHMYSTRRARAADEAAAVAEVAEAEAARQRQRMTIRLGRLNDLQ